LALADELGEAVGELIQKSRDARARDARDLLVAIGIGIEKCELLSGGATARVDHGSVGGVKRVQELRDEVAARRATRGGPDG
jgi:hypothetical protein